MSAIFGRDGNWLNPGRNCFKKCPSCFKGSTSKTFGSTCYATQVHKRAISAARRSKASWHCAITRLNTKEAIASVPFAGRHSRSGWPWRYLWRWHFRNNSILLIFLCKEHMASHTGEVLYSCDFCDRTFNSHANRASHRKRMHPKEWLEDKLRKNPNFVQEQQDLSGQPQESVAQL